MQLDKNQFKIFKGKDLYFVYVCVVEVMSSHCWNDVIIWLLRIKMITSYVQIAEMIDDSDV